MLNVKKQRPCASAKTAVTKLSHLDHGEGGLSCRRLRNYGSSSLKKSATTVNQRVSDCLQGTQMRLSGITSRRSTAIGLPHCEQMPKPGSSSR